MLSIIRIRFTRLKHEFYVLLIMTAMALGFTFLMGMIQSGDFTPTVLIVDNDKSEYSEMLVHELNTNNAFRYYNTSYDDAAEKVEENKVLAAIIIEASFMQDIEDGKVPGIGIMKVKFDRDIYTLESIISSITSKMIGNINIAHVTADYVKQFSNPSKESIVSKAYNNAVESWKYRKPISVKTETLDSSKKYDNNKHLMIGFTLFFSMYTIVFAIGEILNDRENNTWQRLLMSPVSRSSILGGNLVMTFLLGVFQVGILILSGKYLFGLDLGSSTGGLLVIALAFVFTVTSLGLLLSGIVKTHSQLSAVTPIILTSTSMLGGCMWPLDIVNSKLLLTLANLTPQKWAVQGMEKIAMYGADFSSAIVPTLVLVGMGLLFFIIGVRLVRFE